MPKVGWGIETYYNQGNPHINDGGMPDLLVFNGLSGISENITVQPSADQAGQVYAVNPATGGTSIAVVNYIDNSNIIVNGTTGAAGDLDTLYLNGTSPGNNATSGNDLFNVNLTNAGTAGNELVKVTDEANGNSLYNLQTFSNFGTLNINTLGSTNNPSGTGDTVDVVPANDGSVGINITEDGNINDKVNLEGTTGSNFFQVVPGPNGNTDAYMESASAGALTLINMTGVGTLGIVGGAGAGTDTIQVYATTSETFTVNPKDAFDGTISAAGFPLIAYSGLDTGAAGLFSTIAFFGTSVSSPTSQVTVRILGTPASADSYSYTPMDATDGSLNMTTGGNSVTFSLTTITGLSIDDSDNAGPNSLTVNVPAGDDYFDNPGSQSGSGTVTVTTPGGLNLLPVSYVNVATVTPTTGAIAVVSAPAGGSILVDATGTVTVKDKSGIIVNSQDLHNIPQLDLDAVAGQIAVTIDQSAFFTGGINVYDGATTGTATVTVNVTTAASSVGLTFGLPDIITGIIGGALDLFGVGQLFLAASGAAGSTLSLAGYGDLSALTAVNITGDGAGGSDTIAVTTTAAVGSTVNFTAQSDTAATITRSQGGAAINITGFNSTDGNLTLANASGHESEVHFIGASNVNAFTVEQTAAGNIHVVDFAGTGMAKRVPIDLVESVGNGINGLEIDGGQGSNTLTVDNSNGLVTGGGLLVGGIFFNAGTGTNSLILTGSTAVTSDIYTPGPGTGQGSDVQMDAAGNTQTVTFVNLSPVTDLVAGPLTVDAAGNAAITAGDTANTVVVNNLESINFANKSSLTINGLDGNDTFNVTPANITLTGGGGSTVNGSTGASDLLTVNATGAIGYNPTGVGAGSVTNTGNPTVTFTGVGAVAIDGEGGNDSLTVTTPVGGSQMSFTPGATVDSGTITQNAFLGGSGPALPSLTYANLGVFGSLTIATSGGGQNSDLDVHGTGTDNVFNVTAAGVVQITNSVPNPVQLTVPINTPGVRFLRLIGESGNDIFNVPGNNSFPLGIDVQGGAGTSDIVNFAGDGTGAVSVDLGNSAGSSPTTITEAGFSGVSLAGIEVANVSTGANATTVTSTSAEASLSVTPTGANAASVTQAGLGLTVNVTNTGTQTLTVGGSGPANTVTVNGTAGNDAIGVVRAVATDTVTVNALQAISITNANTASLVVATGLGTDSVAVSGAGGPVLTVAGGQTPASASLSVTNTAASGSTTVTPGATNDSGTVTNTDGIIKFSGLTAVTIMDTAPAGTNTDHLTVGGTNGNDTITAAHVGSPGFGAVWVNSQAVVSFTGFNSLALAGKFGNDTFNVSPVGIAFNGVAATQGITVTGTPSSTDSLTVYGSAGADAVAYNPAAATPNVAITNAPVVNFGVGVTSVSYNGQGGNDLLTINAPANSTTTYNAGSTPDSGSAQITTAIGSLVPLTFTALGNGGQTVTLAAAGSSTLIYNGTPANDTFGVSGVAGGIGQVALSTNGIAQLPLQTTGVTTLRIKGVAGVNTFTETATVALPLPYTTTTINGSGSADPDVVNLNGNGTAVTANLGTETPTVTGGGLGTVDISGVGTVNLSSGAGNVLVQGTAGADNFSVTPSAATTVTFQAYTGSTDESTATFLVPVLNATTTTGTFTLDPLAGNNAVTFNGTPGTDTINIVTAATPTTTTAQVVGLPLVSLITADVSSLDVAGNTGDDTFNVFTAVGATLPIHIDGDDLRGTTQPFPNGDQLIIHPTGLAVFTAGALIDEGSFLVGGTQVVSYEDLVSVSVLAPGLPVKVDGTNGNDIITVIADGPQMFTVSVNNRTAVQYTSPFLFIDTLAGNDVVDVKIPPTTPAGVPFVWDVQTFIAGRGPESGVQGLGDTIELDALSSQDVIYTPNYDVAGLATVPPAGSIVFTQPATGGGQFNDVNETSTITATGFIFGANVVPPIEVSPSSGAENFIYAGEGGNGSLSYTTQQASALVYTPGATQDSGVITGTQTGGVGGSDLTPLTFTNLGTTATITFHGPNSTLTANGTPAADLFFVNGAANTGLGTLQLFSPTTTNPTAVPTANLPLTDLINLNSITALDLKGNGGNSDIFDLVGALDFGNGITVDGDATLDLSGATGAVTATLGDPSIPTYTTITGYGATVTAIGITTANLSVGANATTVSSTEALANLSVTPTGTNSASISQADIGLTVNVTNTSVAGVAPSLTVESSGTTNNSVTVNGTAGNDTIAVIKGAGAVATTVQVNGFQTISLPVASDPTIIVSSGDGNDTINVTGTIDNGQLLNVQGRASGALDPQASDTLNITMSAAGFTEITQAASVDSGEVLDTPTGGATTITEFSGIQNIGVVGLAGGTNEIQADGTDSNDTITLSNDGGGNEYYVNSSLIVFYNFQTADIAGNFGDDIIKVAPTTLTGVSTVQVFGSVSSVDSLEIFGNAGANAVTYTPGDPALLPVCRSRRGR